MNIKDLFKTKDTEIRWLAKYTIDADDNNGPWELFTPDLPISEAIKQYGTKIHYHGLYRVGFPSRRINKKETEFK